MSAFGRWMSDFRNGLTIAVSGLVVLLIVVVANGAKSQHRSQHTADLAIANQTRSAAAASRRIDLLTGQIGDLQAELDQVLAATTAAERQTAVAVAEARRQSPTTTTTRPTAPPTSTTAATTAPKPPTPTTASTAPLRTTTTAPCVTVDRLSVCVQQRASRGAARDHMSAAYDNAPCGGWLPLVSQYPWPVSTACRILWCESRADPNAKNGRYHGLMQVDGGSFDPATNVAQAFAMWQRRGWQPWTCR